MREAMDTVIELSVKEVWRASESVGTYVDFGLEGLKLHHLRFDC